MKVLKNFRFVIVLLLCFAVVDYGISVVDPINNWMMFYKNDLAKTKVVHPGPSFDKVIFGNSSVIASYMESRSQSGFINMGINYGKLTDLDEILNGKYAIVNKEVVIGLNFFTMMDSLPTDPYYPWHRKIYEPYCYFYRDQFQKLITDSIKSFLTKKKVNTRFSTLTEKELYHGRLSDKDLDEKVKKYKQEYGSMTLKDFSQNMESLNHIISFCSKNKIRLRVIWMPWNSYYTPPDYVNKLKSEVNKILQDNKIETIDMSGSIDRKYFHDLGHLNIESGSPLFTKEIEQWLRS